MNKVEKKRQKEQYVVEEMIRLYCRKNHGKEGHASGGMCPECQKLADYAKQRSQKCPFMEQKTFCANCKVHCYKPEMREKIRAVMRFGAEDAAVSSDFSYLAFDLQHEREAKSKSIKREVLMIKTRLVGLLSHAKKYIVYTILWQWAALLSQVIAVFTVADLLERVVYGAVTAAAVKRTIFTLAIVVVIRFFCERMGARSSYLACVDVKRILREKIYEKMLKLGASYSEQVSSSEVVQVSTEGVEQLETYFGKYLPQLFYSLIAPLTLFVILCRVSMKASVILLICVPLIPISIVVVQKIAKKLLNKYWSIYTGLGDSFLENLQGLTTLKIYQADQQKADEMDVESQNFRRITMKVLTMQLNSTSVMDIVAYGGAAVGMAVAVSEFLKGNLTVSGTLCIVLLASEFFLPLRLLGSFFHIAMNGMAASDKIFKILDLPEPQAGERTLPDGPLDVVLEDVHFSYD